MSMQGNGEDRDKQVFLFLPLLLFFQAFQKYRSSMKVDVVYRYTWTIPKVSELRENRNDICSNKEIAKRDI